MKKPKVVKAIVEINEDEDGYFVGNLETYGKYGECFTKEDAIESISRKAGTRPIELHHATITIGRKVKK